MLERSHTGDVAQHVEPTERGDRGGHGRCGGGMVADIADACRRPTTGARDLGNGGIQTVFADVGTQDARRFAGQPHSGGAPDAGRRAGNKRHFPVESWHDDVYTWGSTSLPSRCNASSLSAEKMICDKSQSRMRRLISTTHSSGVPIRKMGDWRTRSAVPPIIP